MKKIIFVLCLSSAVYLASCNKAPFIKKCKGDDAECIRQSTQAAIPIMAPGMPELGFERLDPLELSTVNASSPHLNLIISDIKVEGTRNCEAKRVERDVAKSKLFLDVLCTVKMNAHYVMKGQLLLPIEGDGAMRVDLNKILIRAEVDLEDVVGKDTEKHWNIKKWKHNFELQDKSHVDFDNLFGGNEVLAKTVKDLIADNGNDVITSIAPDVIKAVVAKVVKNCNHFFRAVPLKDLVLS